jgi:hypothetical protein
VQEGKAKIEATGEVLGNGIDERVLKIKCPNFYNFTGKKKPDIENSISFFDLRNIWATCEKQIAALQKTIEAVKVLIGENEASEKQPAPPKKNTASR